eukprot:CAMPEP_0194042066 /NCGR_PEP_ID=MMETSP0009_2-20130614/13859_1 /TAXON_ID=210454 /ORGANISM="Grammatophora oceanica, Strain CCMP 410" /LENGTH=524 /DNA_ID=CAMNT_0038685765 /DNA_START=13 /DNA_END=1587 /DNA_ORIENTATION=+
MAWLRTTIAAASSSVLTSRKEQRRNKKETNDTTSTFTKVSRHILGNNNYTHHDNNEKPKYGRMLPRLTRLSFVVGLVLLFLGIVAVCLQPKNNYRRNAGYRTEPPPDLHVAGRRDSYTPVPPNKRKHFYISEKSSFRTVVIRAFRNQGWRKAMKPEDAQFVYTKKVNLDFFNDGLEPYQRYNYSPGFGHWDSKARFAKHFMEWKGTNPTKTFYLPVTYRLESEEDRKELQELLLNGGGMTRPWVVKAPDVNNGAGVQMMGPNSPELRELAQSTLLEEEEEIVQAYICNELPWRHNQKFDLRFYWMIASMDPLIILYHDGYVRVGNAEYNENDWSSTTQHLTTHTYLAEEDKGTITELESWLQEYYDANKSRLSKIMGDIRDPVVHVRNQLKEMVAQTADCFKEHTFGAMHAGNTLNSENGYAIYGFDSILDRDLDAWYIEAQAGPGMEEEFDFRVEMHRDLLRTMIAIVEEIQTKQETDAKANLLPLESLGGWEIVYADGWMYEYEGYKRVPQQEKASCGAKEQ